MGIDLAYIDEVEPEFAIELRKSLEFQRSDHGKDVNQKLDQLEIDSEKTTVSLLVAGDVDAAKTTAALASAIQRVKGILWDDNILIAEDITSRREGEDYA